LLRHSSPLEGEVRGAAMASWAVVMGSISTIGCFVHPRWSLPTFRN